jgi:DNA polymerase III subunit epsilon
MLTRMRVKAKTGGERRLEIKTPLAFLDLETTGGVAGLDRIVEIGVFKLGPRGDSFEYHTLINPEIPIPCEVTAVHGIHDKDVQGSPTFGDVARDLAKFLEGCDLAGYNLVRFDLPILAAEFERVGQCLDMNDRQVVDLMSIYHKKEPRDLNAAHRFYCGTEHTHAHSAFADARACWDVLQGQLSMYPDLPNTAAGLGALTAEQTKRRTLDSGGWFDTRNGQPAFARGKQRGMLLREVATNTPDYVGWMMTLDLPEDTLEIIRRILPRQRISGARGAGRS